MRDFGDIAVAIRSIGLAAGFGNRLASRRLRILPRRNIRRSAGCQWRRLQSASVGWRTRVLVHPKDDLVQMLDRDLFADVLHGGDSLALPVAYGLTAGVNAGKIGGVGNGLRPCQQIGGLIIS